MMQSGISTASKEAMLEGAACGSCHDGSAVFGVDDDACERCHSEPLTGEAP
jgi:c(7)-type cytochrome triheme protein